MVTDDFLNVTADFSLLSLRDLLAARELFHLHLINKLNVVATAVGRYRIRKHPQNGASAKSEAAHPKRTLANSEIRPDSWPSILVFVDKWVQTDDLTHPQDAVPPAIYMPNGQKVPICVVEAERDEVRPEGEAHFSFPASVLGGGFPVVCDVQGQEHVASVACLVTDGHKTYALTNRHSPVRLDRRFPRSLGATRSGSAKARSGNSAASCSLISIHRGPATKSLSTLTSNSSTSTT